MPADSTITAQSPRRTIRHVSLHGAVENLADSLRAENRLCCKNVAYGVKPGHCGDVCYTIALPPKADVRPRSCYVAEVPNSDITDRMGPRDFAERNLWNAQPGRTIIPA